MRPIFNSIPGGPKWGLLLICLLGYSTLNRGFAYIGYYPIFIGETTLLFYLIILNHNYLLRKFFKTVAGKTWLLFLIYNSLIFLISSTNDFNESIRNCIYWVYAIYLYVGFSYGTKLIRINELFKFEKFLLIISLSSIAYFAIYPIRAILQKETAFLYGGTSLVGYHSTLHALALGFMLYPLFVRKIWYRSALIAVGLSLVVFVSQSRGAMLGMIGIFSYLLLFERKTYIPRRLASLSIAFVLLVVIYGLSGVELKGQRGPISVDFMSSAFDSIFVDSSSENLEGSRADRLLWWKNVVHRTTSSTTSTLFGIGMDKILLNRKTGKDTIIRYPHNSFVSVFAFSGLVGLGLYLVLAGRIFFEIFRSKNIYKDSVLLRWYPIFAIGYLVSSFFSTVFEAPFHSFVFWTLSGVSYSISSHYNQKSTDFRQIVQ